MNVTLPIFINYFFNIFVLYISHTTLLTKPFKNSKLVMYLTSITIISLIPMFIYIPNTILIFFSLISFFIFANNRFINTIIALLSYIFSIIWNYTFLSIYNTLTGTNPSMIIQSTFHSLIVYSIYCITLYLLLRILKTLFGKLSKIDLYTYKSIMISLFLFLLLCVFIFVVNFSYEQKLGFPKELTASNQKLFILFFFFTAILLFFIILIIQRDAKNRASLKEMEYLKKYTEEIENMYSSVRSFKHDYTNVLYSMKLYIDTDNVSGLKNYFYSDIIPLIESLDMSTPTLEQLSNIKIPELKSILYLKILQAQKYGIKTNLEINWIIDDIKMKPVDITRIIGIFLDNSIEAVRDLPQNEKKIRVAFIKPDQDISILIENPTSEHTINLTKIQEKSVSSKGIDRGLGLHNVKSIISRYPNILHSTEHNNNTFLQILEIYA